MPDFFALANQDVSIQPAKAELLNIAAQFEDEEDCYAWCNDNYDRWDLPQRRLSPGRYDVKVTVESMGLRYQRWFRLENGGHRSQLKIELLEAIDDGTN